MTATPDLARCPSCGNYVDADDMTGGQCPVCAGPEPVDPWEFTTGAVAAAADVARDLRVQRDQARRFAAAWQGEAEAYREVVEALTHEYRPQREIVGSCRVQTACCGKAPDHPVHRTIAVIQAELQPEEDR